MTTVDVSQDVRKTRAETQVQAQIQRQVQAKVAKAPQGDARKTIGWFVILCVTLWIWAMSAPSAFARGVPENLADLNEAYSPAVVNISTTKRVAGVPSQEGEGAPFNELFQDFFKEPSTSRSEATQGSGFIVDPSGIVVTNNHVIADADTIEVTLADGTILDANIIGRDEKTDLAVLQLHTRMEVPYLQFADSDTARVGDWVMAIGNPFGLGGSVSAGIISARNRDFESGGPYANYIQTDAAINQGNSGGPLFDMQGRVVGVNTAIFSTTGGSIGIGFAIPSNQAAKIVAELIETGEVRRGWLGVRVQEMDKAIAMSLGLDRPRGALVSEVNPKGPAAKAGFQSGDVIMDFGGTEIASMRDLPRAVADAEIGGTVKVRVLRNEVPKTLAVRSQEKEKKPVVLADAQKNEPKVKPSAEALGLKLAALNAKSRAKFSVEEGIDGVLVIAVDPSSNAYGQIRPGDVIQAVSQKSVATPEAVVERIADVEGRAKTRPVLIMLNRGGAKAFVAVEQ